MISRDTLEHLYLQKRLSRKEIAAHLGVSLGAVNHWLTTHHITNSKVRFDSKTEPLYNLYITQNLSYQEIATQTGIRPDAVMRKLKRRGIVKDEAIIRAKDRTKFLETMQKKYGNGITNWLQVPKLKAKMMKKKDGVIGMYMKDDMSQSEISEELGLSKAAISSRLKRRGIKKDAAKILAKNIKNGRKKTREKYGVDNVFELREFQDKAKARIQELFGIDSEWFSKKCYKLKKYKFPSGREVYVQGFEPLFLDILISEGVHESEICVERRMMPKFFYEEDGRTRRYYPDVYIHISETIYEVKSEYYYHKELDNIKRKVSSVLNSGFKCEIVVFDNKKRLKFRKNASDILL